jgi:hypothetical protein
LTAEKQTELKKWILDRGYKFDSFEHRCLNKNFNQALWPASAMGLGGFAAATQLIDKRRAWVPGLALFLATFRMRRGQLEGQLSLDLSKSDTILGEKVRELMGQTKRPQSFEQRSGEPSLQSGSAMETTAIGMTAPPAAAPGQPSAAWDKVRQGGQASPSDLSDAPAASSPWWDGDAAKEEVVPMQPQTFEAPAPSAPSASAAGGAWDRIRIQEEEKQKRLAEERIGR